ncbi:MAG: tetratricopeptide repeat protein [Acetobacteraceae bacterium]|nr:tetratricopeptide repeat protein [Acetobacteraceae bacterium]
MAEAAGPASIAEWLAEGHRLRENKEPAAALEAYRRAVHLAPNDLSLRFNIGLVLLDLNRPEEALVWAGQAASAEHVHLPSYTSMGEAFLRLGRHEDALPWFEKLLAIEPRDVQARLGRGLTLLGMGQLLDGFMGFEARLEDRRMGAWQPKGKYLPWRGDTDLRGRRILVSGEQGLGDNIMMARYLPMLRARGAYVIVQVYSQLIKLLEPLADLVVPHGQTPPAFALHIPMMSLPRAFRTTITTIPATTPYLAATPATLKPPFGPRDLPRIGLAWSGNPNHPMDRQRSTSLAALRPLLARVEAEFHVLHMPMAPAERAVAATLDRVVLHPEDRDFDATASLVAAMDLVICVDTSIAHLAGALGRPVWLLLAGPSDFRWLRDRRDSPWYPTMRLFRRAKVGDWAAMVEDVIDAWHEAN